LVSYLFLWLTATDYFCVARALAHRLPSDKRGFSLVGAGVQRFGDTY